MMPRLFGLCALIALSACTIMSPAEREALDSEFRATIPTCQAAAECERKWAAARNWVLQNSGMKIQHITNDFIETYNPPQYGSELAVRITKDPLPTGGYLFRVRTWCNDPFGCSPDAKKAAVDFNRQIAAVR